MKRESVAKLLMGACLCGVLSGAVALIALTHFSEEWVITMPYSPNAANNHVVELSIHGAEIYVTEQQALLYHWLGYGLALSALLAISSGVGVAILKGELKL